MIYIDELFTLEAKESQAWFVGSRTGHQWCHMWWDGQGDIEDLHRVAKRIGLKREWFQIKRDFPHYDLTPGKRTLALMERGVAELPLRTWVEFRRLMS